MRTLRNEKSPTHSRRPSRRVQVLPRRDPRDAKPLIPKRRCHPRTAAAFQLEQALVRVGLRPVRLVRVGEDVYVSVEQVTTRPLLDPPSSFPPSSFLLPPSSFLLPPSSFLLPPSSFLLPPSSFLLPPSSFFLLLLPPSPPCPQGKAARGRSEWNDASASAGGPRRGTSAAWWAQAASTRVLQGSPARS